MPIQPIRIVIQGVDKFASTIAQSQKRIAKFDKSVSRAGRMMTIGLTLPMVAMGAAGLKTTAQFEQSMLRVGNLTGATGTKFAALESQARGLGATTLHSASQAAEGMGFLGMAGFNTEQIMAAMPATLDLATAAQLDLGRSADIVSNILTSYGKDASETMSIVDLMTDAFQSSNTNMEQMAEAMKFVAPVASGMKIPIEDTATAIGMLSNAGIQGAMAGTQLRGVLGMLAAPTNKARAALTRLKIPKSAITDSAGNVKNLGEVIAQFEKSGASTSDMLQIFGRRIGPGMAALVSQGAGAFKILNKDLRDNEGSARDAAKAYEDSFIGQLKTLKSAAEELAIAFFKDTGILKSFTGILQKVIGFVRRLTKVNPDILKMAAIFGAIVAAAGPLLMVVGSLISAFASISGAIAGAGGLVAILSNPIGWVIGAIALLIGLVVLMRQKFGFSIKKMAMGLLFLTGPIGLVVAIFMKHWGKILPFIKLLGWVAGKIFTGFLHLLYPVFFVLQKLGDLLGWVSGLMLDVLTALTRMVLPKWLEDKLGFTAEVAGGAGVSASDLTAQAVQIGANVNENKIVIEDKVGVKLKGETKKGSPLDTEVIRGLGFQGAF